MTVLEKQRKKVVSKILLGAYFIIPIVIVLLIFFHTGDLWIFWVVLGGAALYGVYYIVSRKYVAAFKGKIIEKIIKFIDPNSVYLKNGSISQTKFKGSKIFLHRIDRYNGDDHVVGKIGQTDIEFSEIHAQYVTRDSKGRTQTHTIFKGLYFVGEFNKQFSKRTVILPDMAERAFGHIGKMFQSWNKNEG